MLCKVNVNENRKKLAYFMLSATLVMKSALNQACAPTFTRVIRIYYSAWAPNAHKQSHSVRKTIALRASKV